MTQQIELGRLLGLLDTLEEVLSNGRLRDEDTDDVIVSFVKVKLEGGIVWCHQSLSPC